MILVENFVNDEAYCKLFPVPDWAESALSLHKNLQPTTVLELSDKNSSSQVLYGNGLRIKCKSKSDESLHKNL